MKASELKNKGIKFMLGDMEHELKFNMNTFCEIEEIYGDLNKFFDDLQDMKIKADKYFRECIMNNSGKKSVMLKIGLIVIVALVYLLSEPVQKNIKQAIFIMSNVDVGLVKGYILSFGMLAPVVSFLLMIFQSLMAPLPAFIITFANAGLFGWIKGAVLSWSSAMVGAALCFFIARFYGRAAVEKLTSKFALDGIDSFFRKYGNYAILIARLLPFMSFDIVSYAAGLTSMSFWSFFWATGLGQLPATIIYSYIGEMLTGGMKKFVFGLLMMFSLSIFAFVFKKVWDEKNIQKKNRKGDKDIV